MNIKFSSYEQEEVRVKFDGEMIISRQDKEDFYEELKDLVSRFRV